MSRTRKELFEDIRRISNQVEMLGGIVQNEMPKDITEAEHLAAIHTLRESVHELKRRLDLWSFQTADLQVRVFSEKSNY